MTLPSPNTIGLTISSGSYRHGDLMVLRPKRLGAMLAYMVKFSYRKDNAFKNFRWANSKPPTRLLNSKTLWNPEPARKCTPRERTRLPRSFVNKGHIYYKRALAIAPPKKQTGKPLNLRKPDLKMSSAKRDVMRRIKKLDCVVKLQPIKDYTLANINFSPVVRLRDVLKPVPLKPVNKYDFMSSLNLFTSTTTSSESEPKHSVDRKYDCNIPFSSELGQLLTNKDKYALSKEMLHRKTEKIEYHLKNGYTIPKERPYDVTYSKKYPCDHRYSFPSRQFRKRRRDFDTALAFCKPVSIRLERLDVRRHTNRNVVIKDVRVMLTKID